MTAAPDRPRMKLLSWQPINKGSLLGKAQIWLPSGLEISDVAVFEKDGRRWAQMPAEMMRDADGQPITDDRGKIKYRTSIRWATRELQERWSAAVLDLLNLAEAPEPRPDPGRRPQRLPAPRRQAYPRHRLAEPVGADGGRPFNDPIDDIGLAQ